MAYAARTRWRRAELFALVVASLVPDLADVVLPQGDHCRTSCELYTHAFPAVLVLAVAMAGLTWGVWHRRVTATLAGALVLMHVACDLLTGFKPYWFGGPRIGFNLYAHEGADFAIEAVMVGVAWSLLRRTPTPPRWATGPYALLILLVLQAGFDWYHWWTRLLY